ncbi:S66 family peptidase [Streptococcus porcinus]|uniref:LD-carboxypeptidase n=1 Tax=Streptococcus porcinus TaxID=1340 RepID=A0A7W0ARU4_STRPO|nr:S66 peptidase family protein [Streptococcus porcinus]MBA2795619.1 LD-carboxypeptidase [Streptococcus porcinus]
MIKTVGIVSLSSGILGEKLVKHELDLGLKRLKDYGLEVKFLPNALKGLDYLKKHPEVRADDFIQAFKDDDIDLILCAIGGDDTYRLLPYLFANKELEQVVKQKVFLGFSDTTINHLMLYKVGIKTFYGQSFLADICELDKKMLPYTEHYFSELLQTGRISEIRPSHIWYEERQDFSDNALGTHRIAHTNSGFELLKGKSKFSGEILGGCLESLYDIFDNSRYEDSAELCKRYQLFPSLEEWRGKTLFLETSEEKPSPKQHRQMLEKLKETGIFSVINGLLVGKTQDESHYEAYKENLLEIIDIDIPIVYNLNIGRATPRAILPFGCIADVNVEEQVITFR